MAEVKVEKTGVREFKVEVEEAASKTTHAVTLDKDFAAKFDINPEEVVKRSFEFLLKREPKESILSSFSIPDTINRYFPDFESETFGNG